MRNLNLQCTTSQVKWQVHLSALPAVTENLKSTPVLTTEDTTFQNPPCLSGSVPTINREDGCILDFTCAQTWWSRTLGALIPSYGVMQVLDQVRRLSEAVQKLANDTALAIGNISNALASHQLMILQNRMALDYILATQGGGMYHYWS